MRFGKIEYLNLLPFDVFVKGYRASTQFKMICHYKKSYPAKLSKEFLFRRIDSGFISSIAGIQAHYKGGASLAGIIAHKEVWSVLVLETTPAKDYQSATSNALCAVLDLQGAVLIGDRALKYYYDSKHEGKTQYCDMAQAWYEKMGLPFVFGRACFHTHVAFYNDLITHFNRKLGSGKRYKGIKIPHYMLMPYIERIGINKQFGRAYLERIYYTIGAKEKHSLVLFYRMLRLKRIKPPQRFGKKS